MVPRFLQEVLAFINLTVKKPKGSQDDDESSLDSLNESVELLGNLGKGLEGAILREVQFEVFR